MDFKYSLEVIRFKKSGKYYDTVSYGTNSEWLFEVVEQFEKDILNGVIANHYNYMFTGKLHEDCELYEGEDYPNGYPVLVNTDYVGKNLMHF